MAGGAAPSLPAVGSFRNFHQIFRKKRRSIPDERCDREVGRLPAINIVDANGRAADPVLSSHGVFQDLCQYFALAKADLDAVQK